MKTTILFLTVLAVGCGSAGGSADDAGAETATPDANTTDAGQDVLCKTPGAHYSTTWTLVFGDCPESATGVFGYSVDSFYDQCKAITSIPIGVCPIDKPAPAFSCAINELSCDVFVTVACGNGCSGEYRLTLIGSQ